MKPGRLIVGAADDPHVRGVLSQLEIETNEPLVFDAPRLRDAGFSFDGHGLRVGSDEMTLAGARGWLRRYAPTMWGAGTVAGTLEAATTRAFLGLVGAISRADGVSWLTPLEELLRSEDRMLQLQVAREGGARTPATLVTSLFEEALDVLGPSFVAKPLVGGYFTTKAGPNAVYATTMTSDDRGRVDFGSAPFIAQEKIEAVQHLRIVTVESQAWVATLDAESRPLDWRRQESAHSEWRVDRTDAHAQARAGALTLAKVLGIGYSSQDWIYSGDEAVFLDLNPGGQWLFLPEPIATEVCAAVAGFLDGHD